jgi:FkbM family methyltransferase
MKHNLFRLSMRLYKAFFAKRMFYRLNKFLFNLSLRGIGVSFDGDDDFVATGEDNFLRKVSACWGSHPVVFDIGAHRGEYSNLIMKLAPHASLYAFEPSPRTYKQLETQASQHGYRAINAGCDDQTRMATIYDVENGDEKGSLVASVYPEAITAFWHSKPVALTVSMIKLDDFIREHGIASIQLLKIDTEGHELKVVDGLEASIRKDMIDVIQFEFTVMNVFSRSFCRDFFVRLPHYDFYRMLPYGLVPMGPYSPIFCELFGYQNIVAIRKGSGVKIS